MERVAADVESVHFGVGDLDALLIGPLIERTLDLEPGFGGGRGDQLDHCGAAEEWLGAPVLRDVAEQPVLDFVPFRCAGRIVADLDRRGDLVGQRLQLDLPQPRARAVGHDAVRRNHQVTPAGVARAPNPIEPSADRLHRELGRVVRDADADPADIGGRVVDAMRQHLAQLLALPIVHVHVQRAAFGPIIRAAVLEVADQLLLLGVDRDDGLACWAAITCALMCSNWALRSGWLAPSRVLRLTWREYASSSTSSRPTVFGLTSWPQALSSHASFSRLLETHVSGRIGSPIVAGSTRRVRSPRAGR